MTQIETFILEWIKSNPKHRIPSTIFQHQLDASRSDISEAISWG